MLVLSRARLQFVYVHFVPCAFWCCIIYHTLRLQYFLALGIVNHSLHLPFRTAETLHHLSNSTWPIRKIILKYSKIQIYPILDRNPCGLTKFTLENTPSIHNQKYVYATTLARFANLFSVIAVILLLNMPILSKFNSCKIYATN